MEALVIILALAVVFLLICNKRHNKSFYEEMCLYRAHRTLLVAELMMHIETGGHVFMSYDTARILSKMGLWHLVEQNEKNKQKSGSEIKRDPYFIASMEVSTKERATE